MDQQSGTYGKKKRKESNVSAVRMRDVVLVKRVEEMKHKMRKNQEKYESLGKSKENYLKAILITNEKYGACRAVDISRQLSVSKASASIALKKLEEEGFISREDWRITLTEKGSEIARNIYEKNLFFTKWFENLGVSKGIAEADACKIEHIISDETYQKMKKFVTNQSVI